DTIPVNLPRAHIGHKEVPHLIRVLRHWNANVLLPRVHTLEKAKIDRGRVFGEEAEIDAVAQPGCAEGIGVTEPGLNRCHNAKRSYSLRALDVQRLFAIACLATGSKKPGGEMHHRSRR